MPQLGQREPGCESDCPSGMRCTQTLRKLPTERPRMTRKASCGGSRFNAAAACHQAAGRAGTASIPTRGPSRVDLVRSPRRVGRHAPEHALSDVDAPRVALTRRQRVALDPRLQLIDLVERLELEERALGRPPQPRLLGLEDLLPQEARRRAILAVGAASSPPSAGARWARPAARPRAETTRPRPCSREGASNRRRRCRDSSATVRASRRAPCAAARPTGRGGRGRRDSLRSGKSPRTGRRR